jgi:rhomboid protease GluP
MATDGDIDFSSYTREQLDNAVARIDHARYPINSSRLVDEYQRRQVLKKAALASEAETAVPDRMLSPRKAFAVRFEPETSFAQWLGPSRNDFHLVGSGTIRVDDVHVFVTGHRYGVFMGLPLNNTEELGRQYVVNVECQGSAVRFELRVPGEKVCGVTVWLRGEAQAEELSKVLPAERTSDFVPRLEGHIEFERALIAQSPKTPVTYGFIFICVFVYVGTALGTSQFFGMDGRTLVRLGSNFGPYTTDGDWWRLFTCLFLHAGFIHLAFNMWALASFGPVVERLYGSVFFALIYLVAGVAGSLSSVSWNPAVNSVGASGAILGLLAALIAVQMRGDKNIPSSVLRPLRNSSLIFAGVTLVAGFLSGEVDNAAHLGGAGAGFVLGFLLSRPITGLRLSIGDLSRRLGFAGVASILLLGVGVAAAKYSSKRLTGEGLYAVTMYWFKPEEQLSLGKLQELGHLAKTEKWNAVMFGDRIERDVVPFWKEADAKLALVDLPTTSEEYEDLQWLRSITHDRTRALELLVQGLRAKDGNEMVDDAASELKRIQARIVERKPAKQ